MLKPKYRFNRITDVSSAFLTENGIKNIILDIDNTLTYHDSQEVSENVLLWLNEQRLSGRNLAVLSNNSEERVKPFADKLGLPYVCKAGKPLKHGYSELLRRFSFVKEETASIGDQVFTDIWGANRVGVISVMVEPFHKEKGKFLRFKRALERIVLGEERHYD